MTGILGALAGISRSSITVSIDDQSVSDFNTGPTASASYQLNTSGNVERVTASDGAAFLETWLEPISSPKTPYEARATVVTGSTPNIGSALNTWLALTSTRSWGVSTTGFPVSSELLIEIRDAASGVVLDSASVFLTAEVLF